MNTFLPAALPGITAGVILSVGRALAETAVLLFTAGYVMRLPGSLLDSGRALSVHIYDLAMNVPGVDVTLLRKRVGMVFQQPNPFPISIAYGDPQSGPGVAPG